MTRSVRKIAGTVADATLPKTPITIGETTYNLCFDLGALSEAETSINAELARAKSDDRVNVLNALPVQNLSNTRVMFAAALRVFHPEVKFFDALKMVTAPVLFDVALAVRKAWGEAMPEPEADPVDPPQPGE